MWFLIFHRFLLQDWLQHWQCSLVEVWSENVIPSQIVMLLGLIEQRKTTNVGPNKELPPKQRTTPPNCQALFHCPSVLNGILHSPGSCSGGCSNAESVTKVSSGIISADWEKRSDLSPITAIVSYLVVWVKEQGPLFLFAKRWDRGL